MLEKMILNPNEDISSVIVEWSNEKEDFIIEVPKGITRYELIRLVEEIQRITQSNIYQRVTKISKKITKRME